MHFTPPPPIKKPDKVDLSKLDLNSQKARKYKEKYQLREKQTAQKMAQKIADEKRKKRSDFLLDLFKALVIAVATLAIEHFMDIVRLIQGLFLQE